MKRSEEITVFEEHECNLLDSALRTHLVHLYTIRDTCKKPVIIDGMTIEEQIALTRNIKRVVHARTTEGKKHVKVPVS